MKKLLALLLALTLCASAAFAEEGVYPPYEYHRRCPNVV